MPAMTHAVEDPLQVARGARGRHAWAEAFEAYRAADRAQPLGGADLEGLAEAAFFVAEPDVQLEAKERAFTTYQAAGDHDRAAFLAINIAREHGYAGKFAIARVWIKRAEALIGSDGDTPAHGYLALAYSEAAHGAGDLERATELADRAIAISQASTDPDLKAFALSNLGELKIAFGDTNDGIALMEEASLAAVNGELTPFTTGITACRVIGACRDLTDYRRASEWIEATERYCTRQSLSGFPGICRIHRAEVAAVGGAWDQAEQELERATVELEPFRATPPQADGYYAIGEIRRLRGDLEGAEAALREAHARGRMPQPALALIRLAQGNAKAAARAIDDALAEPAVDRWARARLLPARVEVAVAMGDIDSARRAADELANTVSGYPSPALEATRHVVAGQVLLADERASDAIAELRAGIAGWRDVGAPYEVARARVMLARALRTLGDEDGADLEAQAAGDAFRRLGARLDLDALEQEARDLAARRAGPTTARRTFAFTDIVGSTELAETLGDAGWEGLLQWHDDTIRSVVARHQGEIVKSTGDGFFATFEAARPAVDAAIGIQRAMRAGRPSDATPVRVRIGLHTADANLRSADYSGRGVHIAARVCGQAGPGEIAASAATLAEAGDVPVVAAPVATALKGISEPVSVALVRWDDGGPAA